MGEENKEPHFSKSADKNKDVILEQLQSCLNEGDRVLEVASGTGQHALHFSANLPDILWQPSDVDLDRYRLIEKLKTAERQNLADPISLDVAHWPNLRPKFDAVYSANCVHIINKQLVEDYVRGVCRSLKAGGKMLLYGPFKFGGDFTTPSNADFDRFLRETYPGGGIRDFEWLDELAETGGLKFQSRTDLPANNHFLIWQKASSTS